MAFENRYSLLDRSLHRLSFGTRSVQVGLADIEEQVFRKQLQHVAIQQPVFITGLPRAGTTLLLELCVDSGEFATHTYRDMPFLLNPMLWRQFSAIFSHADVPRERAHGDGMLVSVDSAEAFEEIVWHTFMSDALQRLFDFLLGPLARWATYIFRDKNCYISTLSHCLRGQKWNPFLTINIDQ